MKLNLLFPTLFVFFVINPGNAQIVLQYDTVVTDVVQAYEVVGHNKFTNALPQTRSFRWVRTEVQLPAPWLSAICDANTCYTPGVDSAVVELGPGSSSILDAHLLLNQDYEGYALIEIFVKDLNNPASNVTAIYIFDSGNTSGTNEGQRLNLKLFPNPSVGLFTLENTLNKVGTMEVYSTAGQLMTRFQVEEGNWYDIANLASGTYIVKLFDTKGLEINSKLITKI